MFLPFFNKYPYTNFEQLNLDWLMDKISGFDKRITDCETTVAAMDERVTNCENDISSLTDRVNTAEDDIDALEGRMDTAEDDIDALEGRMDTAEDDIDALEGRMDTAEDDIDALEGRVDDLENTVGDNTSGLVKKVNDLETEVDGIPIVSANPGGTGTTLNTIEINNIVYEVPSGGGGGSSVTANPSGTATDTLNKLDVDGTIYAVPSGGSGDSVTPNDTSGTPGGDLTSLDVNGTYYNVQNLTVDSSLNSSSTNPVQNKPVADAIDGLDSRVSDLETSVGDNSSGLIKDVNDLKNIGDVVTAYTHNTSPSDPSVIDDVYYNEGDLITLTPGKYIVDYMVNFLKINQSNSGVSMVFGLGLRDENNNIISVNVAPNKYVENTYQANGMYGLQDYMHGFTVLDVASTMKIKSRLTYRLMHGTINSGQFTINHEIRAIRIK